MCETLGVTEAIRKLTNHFECICTKFTTKLVVVVFVVVVVVVVFVVVDEQL